MKTKLYEYLRETMYPFWETYVSRQSIPKEYLFSALHLLTSNASCFISFMIDTQLYGPVYRSFDIPSTQIHNEFFCLNVQNQEIEIVCGKPPDDNHYLHKALKKTKESAPNWSQATNAYTPFQHLIELENNRVMGILGCYIYDSENSSHRVFIYNFNFPETYSYNSQLEYYKLNSLKKYELLQIKEEENSFEFLRGENYVLKIIGDEIYSLLKNFPKKTVDQYLTHKKLLEGLHLRIFTDLQSEEISRFIGYKNPNTFYVAFKNHFGMSPSEVQKQQNYL